MTEYPHACRQCGHTFTEEEFAERHEINFHGLEQRNGDNYTTDNGREEGPS